MGILSGMDIIRMSSDEIMKVIDRNVLFVGPKISEFNKWFPKNLFSILVIDEKDEVGMQGVANELEADYFDLSDADNYRALARELPFCPFGVIFDNVDAIPESDDKEKILQLVLSGFKKEKDVALLDDNSIDFSTVKFGARCKRFPDYLDCIDSEIYKILI